jgi:hypothetical protein
MFGFDFRKPIEFPGIHAADGIGKLRREHRNAVDLRHRMLAGRTPPARRPDRFIGGNRLGCATDQTPSPGASHLAHAARTPVAPLMGTAMIMRDFIIE